MKKWTRLLLGLAAVMAFSVLLGTVAFAGNSEEYMPLDGKYREFFMDDEEPSKVGGTLSTKYYGRDNDGDYWFRIFVSGYGLLSVNAYDKYGYGVNIMLLNRNHMVCNARGTTSDWRYTSSSSSYTRYYGVARGPYYICIKNPGYSGFYVRAREDLKSNMGGSSQYYSRSLSYNKTYTGVMPCNEDWRNVDWYTFYMPYSNRIRVYFRTQGDGYVNLKLYGPNISSYGETLESWTMNKNRYTDLYRTYSGSSYQYSRPAGRYYLKVERSSSTYKRTSCTYWLRWKNY